MRPKFLLFWCRFAGLSLALWLGQHWDPFSSLNEPHLLASGLQACCSFCLERSLPCPGLLVLQVSVCVGSLLRKNFLVPLDQVRRSLFCGPIAIQITCHQSSHQTLLILFDILSCWTGIQSVEKPGWNKSQRKDKFSLFFRAGCPPSPSLRLLVLRPSDSGTYTNGPLVLRLLDPDSIIPPTFLVL